MSRLKDLLTSDRSLVMGIVNVTPDSFSDGGQFLAPNAAANHARLLVEQGADIVDVGGESTRPGAAPVSEDEEIGRVLPVIKAIRETYPDICISVDTSNPGLICAAAEVDVDLINDVRALRRPGALEAAALAKLPVCLMHMQGDPLTMQLDPNYQDLVAEINEFFQERIATCRQAGIADLVLDPGFGFGKTPAHNLTLVNQLDRFLVHGLPLLVGLSRKSTIAKITSDRISGSLAGALIAVQNGAKIIRVHDVAQTVAVLKVMKAVEQQSLVETQGNSE